MKNNISKSGIERTSTMSGITKDTVINFIEEVIAVYNSDRYYTGAPELLFSEVYDDFVNDLLGGKEWEECDSETRKLAVDEFMWIFVGKGFQREVLEEMWEENCEKFEDIEMLA